MKTNYILVDFENVQPTTLTILDQENVKIIVFVGKNQTKISLAVAIPLQDMGHRAEYVQISGNGANALDFHIAFTIGQLAATDPQAYFHIISKDTGFDPLIEHLKHKKIRVCRSHNITDIPLVRVAQAVSPSDKVGVIITNLQQRGTSKPRTLETLTRTVSTLFQQKLPEVEITALIHHLQVQGVISVDDKKVSYALPT